MTDLKNKVALITGSTKGIGRAIAERYARLGAHIVLNYPKDKAAADDALESIKKFGVKVIAVKGDVSNVADIEHVFEEAVSVFGQINIVVANAGVELVNVPFEESTEDQFDHLFDINTKEVCCKACRERWPDYLRWIQHNWLPKARLRHLRKQQDGAALHGPSTSARAGEKRHSCKRHHSYGN